MKILIFLLFPLFLSAQAYSNRGKGEVFKSYPEKPYEDVKKTGVIVVDKTLYGLKFKDSKLPKEVKNRVQKFFNKRYNGYTDLKTYELHIEDTTKGWKIEGHLIKY